MGNMKVKHQTDWKVNKSKVKIIRVRQKDGDADWAETKATWCAKCYFFFQEIMKFRVEKRW